LAGKQRHAIGAHTIKVCQIPARGNALLARLNGTFIRLRRCDAWIGNPVRNSLYRLPVPLYFNVDQR
jgi:hypothetical protein